MRANRAAFTLIELMVALVVGALVLLGARALLDGVGGIATATRRSANAADARANAELLVRQVVGNLALAPDTMSSFTGSAREATFTSWCPSPRGGLAPCGARLLVQGDSADIVLFAGGARVTLLHGVTGARLRYLGSAGDGGAWQARWSTSIVTPLAIGVESDHDTLLLAIGERR